ncbi:MAG: T9SS type A sorting domain-containing protein [Bacteroidales bacterium]|nr:T9SS type A sorting domain-containing protein [Bacteroidales bacterium]
MARREFNSLKETLDMSGYSKGIYIVEIKYQNKIFKQRIIKE